MSYGRRRYVRSRRSGTQPAAVRAARRATTRRGRRDGTRSQAGRCAEANDFAEASRQIAPDLEPGRRCTGSAIGPGTLVGTYRIDGPLGVGGMGDVYRARDLALGRDVAIKVMRMSDECHPRHLLEFDREARMLAALTHPHIGAIYAVIDLEGARGLVLELVDGPTLAERLRLGGPLTPEEAISYGRQLVDALEAAHEKGIVHRDLKPANLAIASRSVLKVLDFGIAQLAREAATITDAPTMSLPTAGARRVSGTTAYMSPEQARGRAVDKRADIWGFGCVLYEMLTARRAFGAVSEADTIAAVLHREPDLTVLPSSVPPSLRRLIVRCLEKDPNRRLRDIADTRLDLDEALDELKAAAARSRTWRWWRSAASVLLSLAGAFWRGRP